MKCKKEIYYFTGTGNSLKAAMDIKEEIKADLIPIASLRSCDKVKTDAEIIGIVFPVYYGEPPVIVKEFVMKLNDIKGKYIFAVCTYGGAASVSLTMLKKIIKTRGGKLSCAFGVKMPQNSFYKPKENYTKIFRSWDERLNFIVKKVNSQAKGVYYTNPIIEMIMIPLQIMLIRRICRKYFLEETDMPSKTNTDDLIRMMDMKLKVKDNCTGCGICSKSCPAGNIEIKDKKPVWHNRCENCLACYNWCPNKAIEGGITKDFYYHHPQIYLTNILKQKG